MALYSTMAKTADPSSRSCCPLYSALADLGDRWTLLIIRELLVSHTATYSNLLGMTEKIATNTLANRLTKLQVAEIITKNAANNQFSLTQKGVELTPALLELAVWASKYDKDSNLPPDIVEWYDRLLTDRDAFLTDIQRDIAQAQQQ